MEFRQQVTIFSSPNFGAANYGGAASINFGFGNEGKTNFALQVTFYKAGAIPTAPSAGEVYLIGSNDGNFGTVKALDWIFGTQNNGDLVDENQGPFIYGQVNWTSLSWGSATYAVITLTATAAKDN